MPQHLQFVSLLLCEGVLFALGRKFIELSQLINIYVKKSSPKTFSDWLFIEREYTTNILHYRFYSDAYDDFYFYLHFHYFV